MNKKNTNNFYSKIFFEKTDPKFHKIYNDVRSRYTINELCILTGYKKNYIKSVLYSRHSNISLPFLKKIERIYNINKFIEVNKVSPK